jgi:ketosteroid isomerase-like protein
MKKSGTLACPLPAAGGDPMTTAKPAGTIALDVEAVRAVIAAVAAAYHARDAAAIARHYAPDAIVADLAPPLLRRGFDMGATQAWLDGWDGPVELTTQDIAVEVEGNLALCHGFLHTRVQTRSGEEAAWWSRITLALSRLPEGWRIIHEHSSVPFHMDGSFRAAVDLEP